MTSKPQPSNTPLDSFFFFLKGSERDCQVDLPSSFYFSDIHHSQGCMFRSPELDACPLHWWQEVPGQSFVVFNMGRKLESEMNPGSNPGASIWNTDMPSDIPSDSAKCWSLTQFQRKKKKTGCYLGILLNEDDFPFVYTGTCFYNFLHPFFPFFPSDFHQNWHIL